MGAPGPGAPTNRSSFVGWRFRFWDLGKHELKARNHAVRNLGPFLRPKPDSRPARLTRQHQPRRKRALWRYTGAASLLEKKQMLRKTFASLAAVALFILIAPSANPQTPAAILTIQADQPVSAVSPTLYGLMTEEINYSYDGGLYAEMVRNRAFHSDWIGGP